jgi:hypothetical protein
MSVKKKSITNVPRTTIVGGRINGRTIIKKIIFGRIITENEGTEEPTVMETDEKMQEI